MAKRGLRPGAVSDELYTMMLDPDQAGIILANWVSGNELEFEPYQKIELKTGEKVRQIYTSSWPYRIVLMALQEVLSKHLEARYSPRLYSYRKGRSNLMAHQAFRTFLKNQVNNQGVFVAKRDITAFGDSIPPAQLFQKVERAFPRQELPTLYRLLEGALRANFVDLDGSLRSFELGIPTGAPITPVLENFYLMDHDLWMDRICEENPDCFYARYGDDFIFATPDAARFKSVVHESDDRIAALELKFSSKKKIECELGTKTRYIEWLGKTFMSEGRTGPRPKHFREIYFSFRASFHALLTELSLRVGDPLVSRPIIQEALTQFFTLQSNPRLSKLVESQNEPYFAKLIDANSKKILVRWYTHKFGFGKSEAWKELRKFRIPSVNFQRRRRWRGP